MNSDSLPVVGFIGLGDQGLPMAVAIAEAGFPLHVWARRPGSLNQLGKVAYVEHGSAEDLARHSDVVALCVGTDDDVFEIVGGPLLSHMKTGGIIVNHGTGTPRNAVRLTELCEPRGIAVLDAPVSGGRPGAESRTLTTMVGGPPDVAERCTPLFRAFSAHVLRLGPSGSGQSAKLFNNALMIMNQANIEEVLALAEAYGLEPLKLVEVLKLGSAASRMLDLLNTMVRPDNVVHLSAVEKLDMEIFETSMTEAGLDASAITTRGLAGAGGLPELIRRLNP